MTFGSSLLTVTREPLDQRGAISAARGELDIETVPRLRAELDLALDQGSQRIDVCDTHRDAFARLGALAAPGTSA